MGMVTGGAAAIVVLGELAVGRVCSRTAVGEDADGVVLGDAAAAAAAATAAAVCVAVAVGGKV